MNEQTIFEKKFKMMQGTKTAQGSTITMGSDIQQTDKGTTAGEAANFVVNDHKLCDLLEPGMDYTITIKKTTV